MPAPYELHISDVRSFKSCRRRWEWSSPLRRNLEPMVTPRYFLVGRGIHYALATFYESGEHPADVYDRFMKAEIERLGVLWPDEAAQVEADRVMGIGMLNNYLSWIKSPAQPDAKWQIISTEMQFGPLGLYNPKGAKSSRIFLTGRIDRILRNLETNEIWLGEFKTTSRAPDPNWLTLDDQVTAYCWAVQQLIGEPVAGIQFRFLTKKFPDKPPRLKSGELSRAINSPMIMSTNYQAYLAGIHDLAWERTKMNVGINPDSDFIEGAMPEDIVQKLRQYENDIQIQYADILDQLQQRGFEDWFVEMEVRKTQAELKAAADDLWLVGLEMVRPTTHIYPAPDWLKCKFCPFRDPCRLKNAGGDYEQELRHVYKERQPEDVVEIDKRLHAEDA